MTYVTWLADVLRAGGCQVIEQPGWETRGIGPMAQVDGVILHHTGGPPNATGTPSLGTVLNGRADLRGPLSNLYLERAGIYHVLAAGKCNHAGPGAWHGVSAGNSDFLGIEAENAGTGFDPWPAVQLDAYLKGVFAILQHLGRDSVWAVGHKEWALPHGRKIDPSFDMGDFRQHLDALAAIGRPLASPIAEANPVHAMLRKGAMGASVRELQEKLGVPADGNFGPATQAAVVAFQQRSGLAPDGMVGPATWSALLA